MSEQLKLIDEKIIFNPHATPDEAREILQTVKQKGIIIGTDEAGRGTLAGEVVAAAVYLTDEQEQELLKLNIRDSKLISESRREKLFSAMNEMKVLWRAFRGKPEEIDRDNILNVSLRTMGHSVNRLIKSNINPEKIFCVIVDGNSRIKNINCNQWTLIKADMLIPVVSAASVVAKVLRDRTMRNYSKLYPEYGFEKNKGYPTQQHIDVIKKIGITKIHRITFCKKFLELRE